MADKSVGPEGREACLTERLAAGIREVDDLNNRLCRLTARMTNEKVGVDDRPKQPSSSAESLVDELLDGLDHANAGLATLCNRLIGETGLEQEPGSQPVAR